MPVRFPSLSSLPCPCSLFEIELELFELELEIFAIRYFSILAISNQDSKKHGLVDRA